MNQRVAKFDKEWPLWISTKSSDSDWTEFVKVRASVIGGFYPKPPESRPGILDPLTRPELVPSSDRVCCTWTLQPRPGATLRHPLPVPGPCGQ